MRSIRARLSIWLVAGLGLLLGVGALALYAHLRSSLAAEIDFALQAQAASVASIAQEESEEFHENPADVVVSLVHGAVFQIRFADGRTFARSSSLHGRELTAPAEAGAEPRLFDLELPDGAPGRGVVLSFLLSSGTPPARTIEPATLVLARDLEDFERALAVLRWGLAGAVVVSLLAATGLVAVALRRGLAPVELLAAEADAIRPEALDARFRTADLPRELAPIGGRLNDLLARLEQAFERERRFNSAVAHELRTPIAELRSLCEVSLRFPEEAGGAERPLEEALDIALQMESLVASLLALRRSESGEEQPALTHVELAPLIDEAWRRLEQRARERDVHLERAGVDGRRLETDRVLLRAVLANLLANAVEYAPRGAVVECRVEGVDGEFRLLLANPAPDLAAADVERLFEPFWRKDGARTDGAHSGLGLALSRSFAHALGMRLEARQLADGRLCFELAATAA